MSTAVWSRAGRAIYTEYMKALLLLTPILAALPLFGQTPCPPTPAYSHCDLVFELPEADFKKHPNPYLTVQLQAEIRSPRHRTYLMPAFWDGGNRMIIRFTPTEPGEWDYRVTGNIAEFNGKIGQITATESGSHGFIKPANVHHWSYTENFEPHLWMGDTNYRFAYVDRALFEQIVDRRAEQKFNHIRGLLIGADTEERKAYYDPDTPNPDHFREVEERILYMNGKGIFTDLVLAGDQNRLAELFPTWQQRERFIRYVVARFAPLKITWQGVQEFEEYVDGRALLKEVGGLIKKMDPYNHPRSTHAVTTSAPLLPDGWMDYVVYQSSDDALGAIEHQLYPVPFVNAEFAYEDSGAGKSHSHHVDSETFRRRLWNSTMNGQYPTFGNTGVYGGRKFAPDAQYLDSPGARFMTHWYDFFSKTRHWELEPYFDVDGGRAVALPGVEYIVYVEKPSGPIEIVVERHSYDVAWFNPATGESIKQKNFKSDRYATEAPDSRQDWVLHISREGRKESMRRSYKFESRRNLMQEVEQSAKLAPFDIEEPSGESLKIGVPAPFQAKLKRETRATRSMMYLWTAEAPSFGQGYRVVGTGAKGELKIPAGIVKKPEGVVNIRVYGLNAVGKVYALDRVYHIEP